MQERKTSMPPVPRDLGRVPAPTLEQSAQLDAQFAPALERAPAIERAAAALNGMGLAFDDLAETTAQAACAFDDVDWPRGVR